MKSQVYLCNFSSLQDNFLLTESLPVTLTDWNKILQIFIVNFSYPGNKILSHNKYIKMKKIQMNKIYNCFQWRKLNPWKT